MSLIACAVLTGILFLASWFDIKSRKIPNRLIVLGIFLGIAVNALGSFPGHFYSGILGFVLGFGLMLIPYCFGLLGAGDVKLFAVVGLFLGSDKIADALVYTVLCGGVLALIYLFRIALAKIRKVDSAEKVNKPSLPYAVAISGGTLLTLFFIASDI
jgi:prepilin peptidase CpaA